jgi:hypothetical protein
VFTRQKFRRDARNLSVKIAGVQIKDLVPKENATGSLGWGLNDKLYLKIGDHTVRVQLNLSVTIIGSKETPESETEGPPPLAARK